LKFYSQITDKPNSVITQTKDGNKLVESKLVCTFINGELETEDPEVIDYLKGHPDKFRTDGPWPKPNRWQETEEGKELLKRGETLGIDIRHIRKEYLIKLIREKEQEKKPENKEKEKLAKATKKMREGIYVSGLIEKSYQEVVEQAKALGIPTHQRKKVEILEDLKQKEVV